MRVVGPRIGVSQSEKTKTLTERRGMGMEAMYAKRRINGIWS